MLSVLASAPKAAKSLRSGVVNNDSGTEERINPHADCFDSFAIVLYSRADQGPSSGSRCSTTKVCFLPAMVSQACAPYLVQLMSTRRDFSMAQWSEKSAGAAGKLYARVLAELQQK